MEHFYLLPSNFRLLPYVYTLNAERCYLIYPFAIQEKSVFCLK